MILSNIVDTVYMDSVLFSVDLSAYPGFKLAGTENSWIEFDTTNLMRKVVTQVATPQSRTQRHSCPRTIPVTVTASQPARLLATRS